MQYCEKCHVRVTGDKVCCPLCQGRLTGEGEPQREVFPKFTPEKNNTPFLLKLVSLAAIAVIIISISINIMVPTSVWWSAFVSAGAVCAWFTVIVGILKKHNVFKNISWQLFNVTILSLLWDLFTGWYGWSVNFVIPCTCVGSMLSMAIWGQLMKRPAQEYLIYIVLDSLYCILPVIFILTGLVTIPYPSVICIGFSILSIAALLIFKGKYILEELARKTHL